MGKTKTQVSVLDLSDEDEIELNICLNNENISGIWDYFKLDPILDKMELQREREYKLFSINRFVWDCSNIEIRGGRRRP